MKTIFNDTIKAVIFDKDGTLLDLEKTWRPLLEKVSADLTKMFSPEVVAGAAKALGINDQGFLSDSVFVKDNFDEMFKTVLGGLSISDEQRFELMSYFGKLIEESHQYVKPHVFDGIEETLAGLKSEGYLLGLATSDRVEIAHMHLNEGRLDKYFDLVLADDGQTEVKPHPQMLEQFCERFMLLPAEIAMVGDSMNDVLFGTKNGMGCTVYVRSGFPDINAEVKADMVIEDATKILV